MSTPVASATRTLRRARRADDTVTWGHVWRLPRARGPWQVPAVAVCEAVRVKGADARTCRDRVRRVR